MSDELLPCGFCKIKPISERNNPAGQYTFCPKCRTMTFGDSKWNELMDIMSEEHNKPLQREV